MRHLNQLAAGQIRYLILNNLLLMELWDRDSLVWYQTRSTTISGGSGLWFI